MNVHEMLCVLAHESPSVKPFRFVLLLSDTESSGIHTVLVVLTRRCNDYSLTFGFLAARRLNHQNDDDSTIRLAYRYI